MENYNRGTKNLLHIIDKKRKEISDDLSDQLEYELEEKAYRQNTHFNDNKTTNINYYNNPNCYPIEKVKVARINSYYNEIDENEMLINNFFSKDNELKVLNYTDKNNQIISNKNLNLNYQLN